MSKVEGKKNIRDYYKDKKLVDEYIETRFKIPIGLVEHKQQVNFVKKVIKDYNLKNVLEIAPGPARVTVEIRDIEQGYAIDSSRSMLELAKKRLKLHGNDKWRLKEGDVFNLRFKKKFDLVMSFRFLFHLHKKEREKIYSEVRKSLRDDGLFIFEAINKYKAKTIRKIVGEDKYEIYDKLYKKKDLIKELEENGFKVLRLKESINHFYINIFISKLSVLLRVERVGERLIEFFEGFKSKNPLGWVVLCQKK